MSMADRDGWIWYDGAMVPWREATTHVLTHTLHYGMGVFEGVRCYKTAAGPAIFRLRDHTDRLFRSAQIFGMKIPFDKETLNEAQRECVRRNELESCYVRPLARISLGRRGAKTRLSATPEGCRLFVRTSAFGTELPELALVDDWAPECS